jgi:sugar phosphate isomerase/epimerase
MIMEHKTSKTIILIWFSLWFLSSTTPSADIFAPEIGVCTSLKNASELASSGYHFIEEGVGGFLMPLQSEEEFLVRLQEAKLSPVPVKACNSFIPGNLKSVGPEAVHDEILAYAETAFRRAQMAGVELIVFGSGGSRRIPEGFPEADARQQFIALGRAMGTIAGKYNVTVVLEPLNRNEVNFINTLTEGAAIVEEIGHPHFRLLADIYHMLMEDESAENIIQYGHLIKHVHVAEKQERSIPGTFNEDLSSYYNALKRINYKGRISIEGRWKDMPSQAPAAIRTIKSQL